MNKYNKNTQFILYYTTKSNKIIRKDPILIFPNSIEKFLRILQPVVIDIQIEKK